MSDSMYYDPSTFDFTDLVDVVETNGNNERQYTKASDVNQNGGVIDDASDLGEFNFPDNDAEEEQEKDPNQDLSDFVNQDAEQAEIVDIVNKLPDDVPLDIDGFTMTKADIKALKGKAERVDQNHDFLQHAADTFEKDNQWIEETLLTKEVAIDRNIAYLEKCLNHPNLSQAQFTDFKDQLAGAKAEKAGIENDAKEIAATRKNQIAIQTRNRWVSTDVKMQEAYPDWIKWRDHLVNDALSRGVKASYIENAYDPNFAQMMLESYQYRLNKKESNENATKRAYAAKAARSNPSSQSAKQIEAANAKEAESRALKKKMAKGGLSKEDHQKMFNYLVD